MIKGLYVRILIACSMFFLALFTGLGIVLGQFFSLFQENADSALRRTYVEFLVIILFIAFLISIFMFARIMVRFAKPIDEVTKTALRISSGDYFARTPITEPVSELSISINKIATNFQEISFMRAMEQERLKTLVESMGSALLMFGREGSVNLANGVFLETFGFTSDQIVGKTFNEIGLPKEIKKLIEHVFMTEQVIEKQVRLNGQTTPSYVSVYGAPVIGRHGNWLGIVVVMHDITPLVRLEEVRKNFVANVSHELRTPITSINGFTETLLNGAMENPKVLKDFLEIIQKEGDRLKLLIDDLLALSGMEREEFTLELAKVDLNEVINDALRTVSGNIERKKMIVELIVPEEKVIINGDFGRLIQVMVNVLSNAITYSKEEKTITITLTKSDENVYIEVKDEGIGIASSELPRLFERFYRVDRARSRDSGGTGLGLAIVKHLVEAHGGSAVVKSEPGIGTSFIIIFPN